MAEQNEDEVKKAEGESAPVEQDVLFRLQMAASDFVLGNAKYAGYLVGALLAGSLIYGGVTSYLTSRREEEFAAIARIDFKMPKVDDMARFGLAPMDDTTDTARMANVEEGAKRYQAQAESAHGAPAVYAYLKAAEAWRRVGKTTESFAALEAASKLEAGDLPGFAADAAYAGALVEAQRTEEALGHYRIMAGRYSGFYAERSLILLASAQADAGKKDDAKLVVKEFQDRFPQSPRAAEMAAIDARVSG